MKIKIILNPYANRWGARTQAPAVAEACRSAGLEFDLSETIAPEHGKQEAIEAVSNGYDAIVAAGGDGTVSEVVNGLIAAAGDGPTRPLGIMPVGTGNDFNDMVRIPRDLSLAAKIIANGNTRQVDAGRITADGHHSYFDNNCALAMEPMVTIENMRMTRISGNVRYVLAVLKALTKLKAWHMDIKWDDGSYEGPAILVSVCNGQRSGGLFRMAPQASMNDGLFDFVIAPDLPLVTILSLLPRLIKGSHIFHPEITYLRTAKLVVKSKPGTPIHADGEVLTESARQIEYDILPEKITLLSP